ncbi:MAG: hypothetical protein WB816_16050 [Methylocystis sp.]
MSNLSALLQACVTEQNVRGAFGLCFNFASGTQYVWKGNGPLTDQNGNVWQAVGNVGDIKGINLGVGDTSQALEIIVSGLDPSFAALAANQGTELKGRTLSLYFLGFNPDWTLADVPEVMQTMVMDHMVTRFDNPARSVTITLVAESFLVSRWRAPNGYLNYADQVARYPGDNGLARLAGYSGPARVSAWS